MRHPPDRHHRRSIRLMYGHGAPCPNHCLPGAYFVTICTRDRECLFGEIVDEVMRLNEHGMAVHEEWLKTAELRENVEMEACTVMPNHVHGIIVIHRRGEASAVPLHVSKTPSKSDASPLRQRPNGTQPGSLSAFVQNFKSISTRKMNAARGSPGTPVWQRGYYEHVVRNEDELEAIREYILGNPARWEEDGDNPLWLACSDDQSPGNQWGT